MYSVGDENVCTVGVPSRNKQLGSLKAEAGTTLIGGYATWHSSESAPTIGSVLCANCGSSSSMVLVAQIYAPITFHRSLYVFACNSRTCSLQSSGWVIVRNQKPLQEDSIFEVPKVPTATSEPVSKGSAWDFLDGGNGAASASAWGDFSFGDEADSSKLDDLEALLNVRDLTLLTSGKKSASSASTAATTDLASNRNVYKTEQCLPCTAVLEEEEYWTAADERAAWEGLIDSEYSAADGHGQDHIDKLLASYYEGEEDMEIVNLVKQQGTKGGKKAEKSSAAEDLALAPPSTAAAPAGTKLAAKPGSTPAPTSKATSVPKRSKGADADEIGDADGDDGDSEAGIDMKLSRSSRRQQVETYFQNRVSYYPTQVLRYAYEGTPLWITHPNPLELDAAAEVKTAASIAKAAPVAEEEDTVFIKANFKRDKKSTKPGTAAPDPLKDDSNSKGSRLIPCCEGCGKARVFECQLMPALLSYVATPQVPSAAKPAPSSGTSKAATTDHSVHSAPTAASAASAVPEGQPSAADIERFRASLGEGLDFGVVAIYSCPDSCEGQRAAGFATEVAVVQAPPDII